MSQPELIVQEKLYPLAIANYLSKLPEARVLDQASINNMMLNTEGSIESKIEKLIPLRAITDQVMAEIEILWLTITDKEEEVSDKHRQAYYESTDENQIKDRHDSRNLEWYLQNGVMVAPEDDTVDKTDIRTATSDNSVPLVEEFKADRLFVINGFRNSRVMHLIHDVIDHPYLFETLKKEGVFEKYAEMLNAIDFVDDSFLYSRQAELIASVGFGFRRFDLARIRNDQEILTDDDILNILNAGADERTLAAAEVYTTNPEVRVRSRFIIENMAIQIADERRRYGAVKMNDGNEEKSPMPILYPMYLAFLIDSTNVLVKCSQKYDRALVQVICMVEQVLEQYALGKCEKAHLPVKNLEDQVELKISHDKLQWILNNKMYLTTYTRK